MNLLSRSFVCNMLCVSQWQSYQLFPATKTGMIREEDAVQLVNTSGRGALPTFTHLPQLCTPDELEDLTGAPIRKLKLWTRRKRNPLPHIRINSHVLRFRQPEACAWLEEHSSI